MSQDRYRDLLASVDVPQRSRRGSLESVLQLVDRLPRPKRPLLDAPSGPGKLAQALHGLGFRVIAADFDAAGFRASGVPLCVLDLNRPLPFADGSFDVVHCGDGIEHLENPFALLRELARVVADGGHVLVTTPNYLSVSRRLRFLFTGSLTKLRRRERDAPASRDPGHISPITLTRLAQAAETAGLELVESRTILAGRTDLWLAPVALAIRAWSATRSAKQKREAFAEHTQSWRMLVGGKKLLALFRKESRA